jgi:hypothetical protein
MQIKGVTFASQIGGCGPGHRRRIERGKGTIGLGKFNPPQIKAGDRLADDPVKGDRRKMVNFHSIGPSCRRLSRSASDPRDIITDSNRRLTA